MADPLAFLKKLIITDEEIDELLKPEDPPKDHFNKRVLAIIEYLDTQPEEKSKKKKRPQRAEKPKIDRKESEDEVEPFKPRELYERYIQHSSGFPCSPFCDPTKEVSFLRSKKKPGLDHYDNQNHGKLTWHVHGKRL